MKDFLSAGGTDGSNDESDDCRSFIAVRLLANKESVDECIDTYKEFRQLVDEYADK